MEIINWIKEEEKGTHRSPNLVAYCLIEAMSRVSTKIDEVFVPFKPEALEVEFKVNGVNVPFTWFCTVIQEHLDQIEDDVKKNLRKETLEKVQQEISNILWDEER